MNDLEHLATSLVEAEGAAEAARAPLEAATEHLADVCGRIEEIAREREVIRMRRAAGEGRPDDGGRLELLTMDGADLATMADTAERRVEQARAAHQVAVAVAARSRRELEAGRARVEIDALDAHAAKLAVLLRETLAHRRAAASKLHAPDDLERAERGVMAAADQVGAELLGAIRDLVDLGARRGTSRFPWAPAEELAIAVRKADAQRAVAFGMARERAA